MADRGQRQRGPAGWREFMPAGALAGAVLVLLVAGAVLRHDSEEGAGATVTLDGETRQDAGTQMPIAEPQTARDLAGASLEEHAASDGRVLRERADGWTLQLLLSCNRDNARRLHRKFGERPELLVIPLTRDGRACWRLCWGLYDDRDAAAAASLPAELRAAVERPFPRPVAELLP